MSGSEQLPNLHSVAFIEELYESFLSNPAAVSREWQDYFGGLVNGAGADNGFRTTPAFKPSSIFNPPSRNGAHPPAVNGTSPATASPRADLAERQHRVSQMVRAYREWGHRIARLDPLDRPREAVPELDPTYYGFSEDDYPTEYVIARGREQVRLPLGRIIDLLRNTYCRSIGVQFTHIDDNEVKLWLESRMESAENRLALSPEEQTRILSLLTDAAVLEGFLQLKYQGDKRFSLEGAESMIPMLQLALNKAAQQGHKGIVIGMAHRGRLNVLAHIIGMSPREIFREFEGTNPEYEHRLGDVKYHLGHTSLWTGPNGWNIHMSLCFNPSHLEYVNPLVMGRIRAIQDKHDDVARAQRFGIQIHGDAAFAGEGIVQECLNMSKLRGYDTGGTFHLIVNNQIGFTTDPEDDRSTRYASDVALMLQIPIFHVNGEDPEAVAQVIELALDFRQQFRRDVVVDMYCWRKYGHNEQDEPSYTQPLMYKAIKGRRSVRDSYLDQLLKLGGITAGQAEQMANSARARLDADYEAARTGAPANGNGAKPVAGVWEGFSGGLEANAPEVPTIVERAELDRLFSLLLRAPEGFTVHPKLDRQILQPRRDMAAGKLSLDWGAAEALAYASLATAGHRVRMSGQDCERGTFNHRHAVWHDYETGAKYMPLANLEPGQAPVEIYNSSLSEEGPMGFEFGYSLEVPDALVLWEAQFGDFANAAQVIIDQFIASCEAKWNYLSGLTLLLPHGFEGAGSEHSSARIERFLALCAEDNMQIVQPTTPAQIFHLLRRQVLRPWRKPLVVMTPKAYIKYAAANPAVSTLNDLAAGSFERILPDVCPNREQPVSSIVLCSGKIYYQLADKREELNRRDVALLRVEQLYPLSDETLASALSLYPDGLPLRWVQEEPENMGALRYMVRRLQAPHFNRFKVDFLARKPAATPATGSHHIHDTTQADLLQRAFQF